MAVNSTSTGATPARDRRGAGTKGLPRAERERLLLDIGERAFGERGYERVSLDEIAASAGVSRAMIYAYFGSKEGFYRAGIRRAYQRCADMMRAAAEQPGEPAERLWRVSEAVFTWFEQYRGHWRGFLFGSQAFGGAMVAEAYTAPAGVATLVAGLIEDILGDRVPASEITPLAEAGVAIHMAIADHWSRHPEESREHQVLRAMNMCWTGLEGLSEGRLWMPRPGSRAVD